LRSTVVCNRPRSGNACSAAAVQEFYCICNFWNGVCVQIFLPHMPVLWQIVCTGIHLASFYPTIVSESNLWKKRGDAANTEVNKSRKTIKVLLPQVLSWQSHSSASSCDACQWLLWLEERLGLPSVIMIMKTYLRGGVITEYD
jgi:hypothetical protein